MGTMGENTWLMWMFSQRKVVHDGHLKAEGHRNMSHSVAIKVTMKC